MEFPFQYVGGGYFRERGVPKGKEAKMLHGMEAVAYAFELGQAKAKAAAATKSQEGA